MKWILLIGLGLICACSQKTALDRCVDAQMKVYDEETPNATPQERDKTRAYFYLVCRQSQ